MGFGYGVISQVLNDDGGFLLVDQPDGFGNEIFWIGFKLIEYRNINLL
jgi:hypothetical protein